MRSLRALGVCAAIAVGASLGTFAPVAMAAPANDNHAPTVGAAGSATVRFGASTPGVRFRCGGRDSRSAVIHLRVAGAQRHHHPVR